MIFRGGVCNSGELNQIAISQYDPGIHKIVAGIAVFNRVGAAGIGADHTAEGGVFTT